MLIRVTEEHIKAGKPDNCRFCPIAIAITEALEHKYIVVVKPKLCYTCGRVFALPEIARNFIRSFDLGKHVEPFEFELPTHLETTLQETPAT
jgi:hypothetical protein